MGDSPFKANTGLMGATESGQRVTADNVQHLPMGSVVRLDEGGVLIHLHDRLWYWRGQETGWCYDTLDRFTNRLPGTLCHHGAEPKEVELWRYYEDLIKGSGFRSITQLLVIGQQAGDLVKALEEKGALSEDAVEAIRKLNLHLAKKDGEDDGQEDNAR